MDKEWCAATDASQPVFSRSHVLSNGLMKGVSSISRYLNPSHGAVGEWWIKIVGIR